MTITIGTSGWGYDEWNFYPDDIAKSDRLAYYATHFDPIEINTTFYGQPRNSAFDKWREAVPEDFRFAVKASQHITHAKRLLDTREPLDELLSGAERLGDKLGPILFQLPPNWDFNAERLESFLGVLPKGYRFTIELRDPRWVNTEAVALLEAHNVAFCIYDYKGRRTPKYITADFVYIRLHGPERLYKGSYSTADLSGWAGACSSWDAQGKDVFVFFDNTADGSALKDAAALRDMLSGTRS